MIEPTDLEIEAEAERLWTNLSPAARDLETPAGEAPQREWSKLQNPRVMETWRTLARRSLILRTGPHRPELHLLPTREGDPPVLFCSACDLALVRRHDETTPQCPTCGAGPCLGCTLRLAAQPFPSTPSPNPAVQA